MLAYCGDGDGKGASESQFYATMNDLRGAGTMEKYLSDFHGHFYCREAPYPAPLSARRNSRNACP